MTIASIKAELADAPGLHVLERGQFPVQGTACSQVLKVGEDYSVRWKNRHYSSLLQILHPNENVKTA